MSDDRALTAPFVMNTYRRLPVSFVRGEGVWLYDESGKQYLDFVAGIAVTALGHAHPKITEVVSKQAAELTHVSNLYYTQPMAKLAERLCELLEWPDGRVFFANSGAEANECAIKVVRRWSRQKYSPERFETIAAFGSFHGRTLETLAATGQPAKWEHFTPLPPGFVHVPFDDVGKLEGAITERTSSVLLEPVQGEGGVNVPGDDYLPSVRKLCDARDLSFIADEVQTGIGRLGHWFGFQASGAVPDVITLAKALGNGLPIGACAARGEAATALQPGDHASTIGGGPVICAAALAVLDVIQDEGLVERAKKMGDHLRRGLESLVSSTSIATSVRGRGLLLALQLDRDAAREVVTRALTEGLLVNDVTPSAVRLSPPLIVSEQDCDRAVLTLGEVLDDIGAER